MDRDSKHLDRRSHSFKNELERFAIKYNSILAFLAGWTAYPIGAALLSLLGR